MGLLDSLKAIGAEIGQAVETAANDYKEKKAFEAAEMEMLESIHEDLMKYAREQIMAMDDETAAKVMALEILRYKSFKKEGYADGFDALFALATEEEYVEWAKTYKNGEAVLEAGTAFYCDYYAGAMQSRWFTDTMLPFYGDGEEALKAMVSSLSSLLYAYIGDLADEICVRKYGEDDTTSKLLFDTHFDFMNPLVVFYMNSDDDMDMQKNLDKHERKCFERYRNVALYIKAKSEGLCNQEGEVEHFYFKDKEDPCFFAVVGNELKYMSLDYSKYSKIADLRSIESKQIVTIPLSEILYWKKIGDVRTEVGLRQPSAAVAIYAASKGIVAPRTLEERKVDTREIEFVTKSTKMHIDIDSLSAFERVIPQYEYDRVMIGK